MEEKYEKLGQLIDSLENLTYALDISMSSDFHVERFREILPNMVRDFKESFIEITGENPWD